MGPLHFLTSARQFRLGLTAGFVAASVLVAARMVARRPTALAGTALAAAGCVALAQAGAVARLQTMPGALPIGVALAGTLAHLAARRHRGLGLVVAAAAPGAIMTAGAVVGAPVWVRVAVVTFGALGGALIAEYDKSDGIGAAPALLLATVAGVYWTVPDTEAARAVLGAAIPLGCLGWPLRVARLGTGGSVAAACLVAWVIGQGGSTRPGAVVGGVATIGVLAISPLVARLRGRPRPTPRQPTALTAACVVTAQLACVAAASRWAGLAHDASTAALRLLTFAPIAVALTLAIDVVPGLLAPRE